MSLPGYGLIRLLDDFGACIAMCFPSEAPIQFGNCHLTQNSSAIVFQRKDFSKETCQQRTEDEEPITEDENIPSATIDNNFQSSHVFGNKYMFVKPKALKRKISRPEETLKNSPSRQLMAFILADKEAEKKATYRQDPVDAFLGLPSVKDFPHSDSPTLIIIDDLMKEADGRVVDLFT
ncbi:hypothetical protein J437_LFUL007174 [Ladona fulva]|uniref:Uncharacterized protein n=1 Tax=Ladona fulva TaxID=123851 RepID=A0A8K0NYL9_LADFU|nr:hypothetical protein J437_LFUL007174 [Ladona fulva]